MMLRERARPDAAAATCFALFVRSFIGVDS